MRNRLYFYKNLHEAEFMQAEFGITFKVDNDRQKYCIISAPENFFLARKDDYVKIDDSILRVTSIYKNTEVVTGEGVNKRIFPQNMCEIVRRFDKHFIAPESL